MVGLKVTLLKIINLLLFSVFIAGCASNQLKADQTLFIKGQAAIERGDFATASGIFSELAKSGYPAAMNNLGVSLLMVNREDEAIYWFNMASRYGDDNARETLSKMGAPAPSPDLIGQHPTQIQQEKAKQFFVTTLTGLAIGVTAYYIAENVGRHHYMNSQAVPNQSQSNINRPTYQTNNNSFGLGSDDQYEYRSFSGNEYKYDLTKPIDRIKYEIDPAAQVFDSINPKVDIDRNQGQFGGGAKW